MTTKTTDPTLIKAYEATAQKKTGVVQTDLDRIVTMTAGVDFKGANAHKIKTSVADEGFSLATDMTARLQTMSTNMAKAASYIATGLGGAAISIVAKDVTITRPEVEADANVQHINGDAMRALKSDVVALCSSMRQALSDHRSSFVQLGANRGWVGPEYDRALSNLEVETAAMVKRITQAESQITTALQNQLDAVGA